MSRPGPDRQTLAPRRRVGRERVEALLSAAAAAFAEHGLAAATMAEIAARADARIGSLYRFFPSKDALAAALMQRYIDLAEAAYDTLEAGAATSTAEQLADSLLDFMVRIHGETPAWGALLDWRAEDADGRLAVRSWAQRRIVGTLRSRAPKLAEPLAEDMAVVLLNNMKLMVAMTMEAGAAVRPGAIHEFRMMNRLYLVSRLADAASPPLR